MFCGCYCGLCCACVLVSGLVTFGCYFPGDLLWVDFTCASALYLMYCLFWMLVAVLFWLRFDWLAVVLECCLVSCL